MANLPSHIGHFEVIRQLGAGGMATVYLGRDPDLGRQVAIKVIREEIRDREVLERFLREARAAAALRHPNIITVYASGEHEHQPYMAIEFVDGDSLAQIIHSRRTVALSDKISYLEQICSGLAFAHRAGIVHRDIKPANIMVDREDVVRILDFGIARVEGSAMTQDGSLMGSLNYMSPEQMLGRPIDHRSDIFSLGSVAYELLSYKQAFKGGLNDGLLHRLPHEDPPPLDEVCPGLPVALQRVVMRALEKEPEKRFQDLMEMRAALVGGPETAPPDDDHTILMRQPPTEPVVPPGAAIPLATGAARFDETIVIPSGAAAKHGAVTGAGATSEPESTGTPPLKADAPATPAPALKLMSEVAGDAGPIAMTAQPAAPPTPRVPPPGGPRARTPDASQPRTPRPTHAQKWVLGSVAGAVMVGALAAIPWLTAEPPDLLTQERPGIQAAMERFRSAYRNRDLPGVMEAFPALPPEIELTMQRAFDDCLVYEVVFTDMQIELNPTEAEVAQVDLRSAHTCTPSSGARQTTSEHHELFALRKGGDAWLIDSAMPLAPEAP
ncbi:MAG: serine/threonine-protein kinase [Acidobacteria bacterium]|nr:serine/threonine-protein kinase [Acidobacteriota bacterium]